MRRPVWDALGVLFVLPMVLSVSGHGGARQKAKIGCGVLGVGGTAVKLRRHEEDL